MLRPGASTSPAAFYRRVGAAGAAALLLAAAALRLVAPILEKASGSDTHSRTQPVFMNVEVDPISPTHSAAMTSMEATSVSAFDVDVTKKRMMRREPKRAPKFDSPVAGRPSEWGTLMRREARVAPPHTGFEG